MKKLVSVLMCAMLLIGPIFLMTNQVEGRVNPGVSPKVPHAPIRINSDADFPGIATGGDGSAASPWKIENYEIDGTGAGYCIYIGNTTEYFVVRNCTLSNASGIASAPYYDDTGLILYNIGNGTIENNTINSNNYFGIYLYKSTSNILRNNTLVENGIHIYGVQLAHWNSHIINISNTVNGKQVHYWKNQTGGTIPADAGQVILANCTNVVVENQNVCNGSMGIELGLSDNNIIANNNASSNNYFGIYLKSSNNNTIINNTANSSNGDGIYLCSSINNTIVNNTVSSNNYKGIVLSSGSSNNTVVNNTVNSNSGDGICLSFSSNDNNVYHNNLIDNTNQAFDNGTNFWNHSTLGGNHWSDHVGPDTDMNGIVDTPYPIPGGGNQDFRPFTKMNGWLNENCTANNDTNTTDEDTVLNVPTPGILANDTDPDPTDVLTIVEVNGSPANVSAQIVLPSGALLNQSANGSFEYDPNGQFDNLNKTEFFIDNYTYMISDGNGSFDNATVFVTVTGVNDAPVLDLIGNQAINEEVQLAFTATATDVELDILIFSLEPGAPAGASITAGGDFTWTPTEAQGPGFYNITIRVTDDGTPNLFDNETIMITVGEINIAPVLDPIGNKWVNETVLLAFTATATDADTPANTLTFSLDPGAPAGASITAGGDFTWTPTEAQGPGVYPVTVNVTDGALYDTETISITVNETNLAPVLGAIGNQTVNELNLLAFTATATDADIPANGLTFSLESGFPVGASITPGGDFTWTPTEAQGPGFYNITIRVTDDGTPNMFDNETFMITVNETNLAPVLDPIGNKWVNETVLLAFTATATDADTPANTLTFTLDAGAPAGASITAGGDFTWTPTEAQGPGVYPVTVNVTDGALYDTETISVTVNGTNLAPVLGAIGNQTVNETNLLAFTATATDADIPANVLTFSLEPGFPAGAGITAGGDFTWTPTEAQGPGFYNITIRVTDDGTPNMFDNETIMITVNETNLAPVLDPIGNKWVNETVLLAFTATATDADTPANTLAFSLDAGAPAGASITAGGDFTWTPTEAQGPGVYPVTVNVTDGALYDTETISITVNETNLAPVLTAIGNLAVNELATLGFTAAANDADLPANTLTFSLDPGFPAGANITASGDFTWTPTEAQGPGTYFVTIRVTDDGTPPLNDSETIQIDVGEVNVAPILGAIGDKVVDEETLLTFTATATDPDLPANTLTFSLDVGAPAGASITAGGVFTWTPTEAQGPGNYSVTIRVSDGVLEDFETINIEVIDFNVAPVASNDVATVDEDSTANTIDVLENDLDHDNDALTIIAITQDTHGTVTITNSGADLTYEPTDPDYYGTDTFTYIISDGEFNDTATVTMTITNVNDDPAANDDTVAMDEDGAARYFDVLANDDFVPDPTEILSITSVTQGLHGTVAITGGGLTYEPDANYNGVDTFTYTISDSNGGSDTGTVTITVNNVNDLPVMTGTDQTSAEEGDEYSVAYTATDIDPLDTLTFTLSTDATWLSIDATRGTVTGILSGIAEPGRFSVRITVSDDNGGVVHHDFILDVSQLDTDDDGVPDVNDAFPADANETIDTDGDGIGNNADTDDDGDDVPDSQDAFPLDSTESVDTDHDGIGNNADLDDDNDGVPDTEDPSSLDNTITGNEPSTGWPYWWVLLLMGIIALIGFCSLLVIGIYVRKFK